MSIINGPKGISETEMNTSANHYATFNELNENEKDELLYICAQFVKFYNSLSQKKIEYTVEMVTETFDEAIKQIYGVEIALKTRANLFYKQVPVINEILLNAKEEKNKADREIKKDLDKKIEEIKKESKTSTRNSSLHYSSPSRPSRPSYNPSPCDGGRSYGPSC